MASDPKAITQLYEQIPLEAMQRVSDSYMSWYVDRVTSELDTRIAGLRAELRENDAKEAAFQPVPDELSAIERLQRSSVTGVDLLDRMVEQGEDWLVLTMRRLDHFERTGLAPKDYSTWCEHALGGAYDWIDHERLGSAMPLSASPNSSALRQTPAAQQPNVPDWLSNRPGARQEEDPTAPVPSVRSAWSENGAYGSNGGPNSQSSPNNSGAAHSQNNHSDPRRPQPEQQDDGKGGRNIFRIFTN